MAITEINIDTTVFPNRISVECQDTSQLNEVIDWLKENTSGRWELLQGPHFYCDSSGVRGYFKNLAIIASFESIDDAMIFKLRWR